MTEFAFELALCAFLESEREREAVLSRQLGTAVHGQRIEDIVVLEPGPDFAKRAAITEQTIPVAAIESDVGSGQARYWKDAFDCHPDRARAAIERAVDVGFFERERQNGRTYVRQTARYPENWYDRLVGIENKPDLDCPGDLETQLQTDVSLGLLDAVVLATESYVTGAHRNRIPDEVGIWRFDPDTGERDVLREPTPLPVTEPGVDIVEHRSGRTDIRIVSPDETAAYRRRVAERAYGKGWRTDEFPNCEAIENSERFGSTGLPFCTWKDRIVEPARECGPSCDGYRPADAPDVDVEAERDRQQPWRADPDGCAYTQSRLDRFGS